MMRIIIACILSIVHFVARAQTVSDSSEIIYQKAQKAQLEGAVSNNLGAGFQNHPSGEFLLADASNDLKYGILIYNVDILPKWAVFSAALVFRDPISGQIIFFRADNCKFSYHFGLTGPVQLKLVNTVKMKLGMAMSISFTGGINGSSATFECNGLKELNLTGTVRIDNDYLLPCNDTGFIYSGKSLETGFSIVAKKWNDFLVQLSLPAFQIKSLNGFVFKLTNVTLDLSESNNCRDLVFPVQYMQQNILGPYKERWQGLWIQSGTVMLPRHFKSAGKNRIVVGINSALFDEFGFSGKIFAKNLIDLKEGNLGGWHFSIDNISLNLSFNKLNSGQMTGKLSAPIFADTNWLAYSAIVGVNDNYTFSIGAGKGLTIPAFRATKIVLDPLSYTEVNIKQGHVGIHLSLTGMIHIETPKKESGIVIPDIEFRNLEIRNDDNGFEIGYLGLKPGTDTSKMNQFPMTITKLSLEKTAGKYIMKVAALVNLAEYLSASSDFEIRAIWNKNAAGCKLQFEVLVVRGIAVDLEKSGFEFHGNIARFEEDPLYGSGFNGQITFAIKAAKISGSGKILFGKTNRTRYWYFDAGIEWGSPGIPLFAGVFANGFVGGAWHHMRTQNGSDPKTISNYGKTELGPVYVPDDNAGLGLRAGINLNGGSASSYQIKSILEMQFNQTGGIDKLLVYGTLDVMNQPEAINKKAIAASSSALPSTGNFWTDFSNKYTPKGKIGGPVMVQYDFRNSSFYGNAAVYINQMANNSINGIGAKGRAGDLAVFFSPSKWFLRIGEPNHPLGVAVGIGRTTKVSAYVYFNAGTELLKAPQPPAEIQQYLPGVTLDEMRNLNELASGAGFAMGARFDAEASVGASDKKFSLYASLRTIVAADLNLRKYNSLFSCSSTRQTPGNDGWFANGNLYAFFSGRLGAKAGNLKLDLLTLTGATSFEASAPNPWYAKGGVYMELNIGSFLRFKNTLNIEIGEPCELSTNSSTDSTIINKIYPADGSKSVSPLDNILVEYSVPVNQEFKTPDGKLMKFKALAPQLFQGTVAVKANTNWDQTANTYSLVLLQPLLPNTKYKIKAEVELVEITSTGDRIVMENGKRVAELKLSNYETGNLPGTIPIANVRYAYPELQQVNYHILEYGSNFIQLKIPQDYLLSRTGNKLIARFLDVSGTIKDEKLVNNANSRLDFAASTVLKTGQIYKLQIWTVPVAYVLNSNTGKNPNALQSNNSATITSLTAGASSAGISKMLLEYAFRCSEFSRFMDKIQAFTQISCTENDKNFNLVASQTYNEYFSKSEVGSNADESCKVKCVLDYSLSTWLKNEIANRIYPILKSKNVTVAFSRDTSVSGLPPTRAATIEEQNVASEVLKCSSTNNYSFQSPDNSMTVKMKLGEVYKSDFEDIRNFLIAGYLSGKIQSSVIQTFISNMTSNGGKNVVSTVSGSGTTSPSTAIPVSSGLILNAAAMSWSSPTNSGLQLAQIQPSAIGLIDQLKAIQLPSFVKPGVVGISFEYSIPMTGLKPVSSSRSFTVK